MVGVSIGICLLLILFCKISAATWNKTIFVSPSGSNNISCGSASEPCQTLDFVFGLGMSFSFNSTRIQLDAGDYSLNRTHSFRWLQNFAITGNTSRAEDVTIECSPNASLGFVLSDRITLENFVFHRCGGWHQSTRIITTSAEKTSVKFRTALYLNYCTDVQISGVHVLRSPGLAITLYDIGGILKLEHCNFTGNMPVADKINSQTLSEGHAIAGGGAFLELTGEGSNPLSHPDRHHTLQTSNNSYSFVNCHFVRNKTPPPKQANHSFLVASFISGGGLGISVESNASNNNIDIQSCEFIGNEAGWGGGIHVELLGPSSNNSINISGTTFKNNRAVVAGGGIRFSANNTMVTKLELPHRGFFENCTFHNNTAIWGGGFSVFGTTQQVPAGTYIPHHLDNVHFKHCHWTENNATVGSAVGAFLDNLNANGIGPLVPYSLLFEHCTVVGNGLRLSSSVVQGITLGLGAIYSIQVPIRFTGNTTIANNRQTALALDSATVGIRDRVIFKNNSGYRGGALTLHGRSSVVFYEESELNFTENHCESSGGAIYVAAQGSPFVSLAQASGTNLHPCFFLYEKRCIHPNDWKTKIVFRGNVATSNRSGNSIYASTLSNCRLPGEFRSKNSVLQWRIITFMDSHGNPVNETDEVSTDPIDISIRADDWIKAPGEVFDASLKLTDETGNSVDGIVHVSVEGVNSSAKLGTSSPMFLASADSGRLQNIRIDGKENDYFNVKLMTFIGPLVQRQINNVKLTSCNPGFHSKGNDITCSCNKGLPDQFGIANCSTNGRDVYIKRGYWAGFVGKQFVSYPCPNNYCKPCKNLIMLYRKGDMCSSDRDQSSILCGSCRQGYSVELGSSRCSKNCNNLYLLLIIPYGIALLLLVMLIMLINLDAFTGYLNAWLYSYQVMLLLKKDEMKFDHFVHFIIGLSELQIKLYGKGLCLAELLDEADVLFISYSVPAYVLLLVVILARIVRRYPRWLFSRKVRAPFRALCTIFVLCYTTITGISLKILHFVYIGGRFVLYQDGEKQFFKDKRHIWYGTIAILNIFAIVIPVPLFLMFTPFFVRKAHQYFHVNLNTFKPMYDTLQSCFKDKYRWFSAFYFVCRFLLLILATFAPFGPTKRCLMEISCILFLAIFLYFRPYKQAEPATADHRNPEEEDFDWINKSDAVLLTNLCLIAVVSSAFEDESKATTVVDILAYVPLLVLIVVLGRAIRKYVSSTAAITRGSRSTTTLIDTSTTGSLPDP